MNNKQHQEAICQLLSSIASEQKSLAHILNAEGDKVIATLNSKGVHSTELLAMNDSVSKTLHNVTKQQLLLQMNLENLIELIKISRGNDYFDGSKLDTDFDKEEF